MVSDVRTGKTMKIVQAQCSLLKIRLWKTGNVRLEDMCIYITTTEREKQI